MLFAVALYLRIMGGPADANVEMAIPLRAWPIFFFFNDTATTEIYTVMNTLSYTTLFRSRPSAPRRRSQYAARSRTGRRWPLPRSEEHTSELQSLITISYAVFCLKKKK